ncbi:MAG TPA: DNA mismatch repair endonuclease MutL [Armatimonadota bacterium]|nr:DNA mismatch repair endonuclease MutL [Armatimonadota bacterium]
MTTSVDSDAAASSPLESERSLDWIDAGASLAPRSPPLETDASEDARPAVAVLSAEIAGQIAAGECVERPASVVKELAENALDAGATRITVEMEDGGRDLIRVIDNGGGMSREDLVLAVQRHATSKLKELDDLSNILTLGFRGEALPSIAAVSRLEIVSTLGDSAPNRLALEGSEIVELCGCGAPRGTTVTVRDLFFNTPARLKFLRSAQTEFGHALEHLTRLAIAHHQVAFRVLHNGREALNSPGASDPLNAIVAAYGPDTARQMVQVDLNAPPFRVYGYVSRPALTRANRSQQSFFVNRRCVRNRTLGHALDQAYRTLLTVGRHPIAAVLIEAPPAMVDVNVHPTKAEVRFLRDWEVHQVVARAIKDALLAVDLVPQVHLNASAASAPASTQPALWENRDLSPRPDRPPWTGPVSDVPGNPSEGAWSGEAFTPERERDAGVDPFSTVDPFSPEDLRAGHLSGSPAESDPGSGFVARETMAPTCPFLTGARVVGQLHRCYIVAETRGGILLVDQHAAHERILYEKFLNRGSGCDVQQLVVPLTLTLGRREAALAADRLDDFRLLGFAMEPFGPDTFLVRTAPMFARRTNYEQLLRDLVDELAAADFGRRMRLQRERIAASMACRAAIKQGDPLSPREMEALIEDLCSVDTPLEVPTNCPHGRPTSIILTLSQVERLFRRT